MSTLSKEEDIILFGFDGPNSSQERNPVWSSALVSHPPHALLLTPGVKSGHFNYCGLPVSLNQSHRPPFLCLINKVFLTTDPLSGPFGLTRRDYSVYETQSKLFVK